MSEELQLQLKNLSIDDVPEFSLNETKTYGKIVDVYDGDTCKIILLNNNTFMRFNCRLKFLDTPEMKPAKSKPNRELEIKNAIRCRNRLMQLTTDCECELDTQYTKPQIKKLMKLNTKIIRINCHEFDKYGRLLVEIEFDDKKTVNNMLIEENFAKAYDGGTKDVFMY